MANSTNGRAFSLSSLDQIETALKGSHVCIYSQDRELKYTAVLNPPEGHSAQSLVGLSDVDVLPLAAAEKIAVIKQRVLLSGESQRAEFRVVDAVSTKWYDIWIEPRRENERTTGVVCAVVDITERKTAEEHLRLVLLELAHRSKNLLALVLSIARQTARNINSVDQFISQFMGRVRSLALAHDALTDEHWRGATLFSLVRSQLSAFGDPKQAQISVEGDNVLLRPNAAQHVALALHELAANALTYGGLSVPEGRIAVRSTMVGAAEGKERELIVEWRETGIPLLTTPQDPGFARLLLEQIVPTAVGGKVDFDESTPGQLVYRLSLPATQFA